MHRATLLLVGLIVIGANGYSIAVAHAQTDHDDEAHGLYSAGAAAFSSGRYEEALEYWQRSYDLSRRPELLFNIGQAADRSRQDELALRSFEGYIEALPDVPNRAEIEGRIRVLRAALAAHAPAVASTSTATVEPTQEPAPTETVAPAITQPVPEEPPPAASASLDVGALALTITGGVLVVAGGVLLGVGAVDLYPPRAGYMFAPENDRYVNAQILVGSGAAALGLGLIGGIIGIVMLTSSGSSSASSALRPTPNGFAIQF